MASRQQGSGLALPRREFRCEGSVPDRAVRLRWSHRAGRCWLPAARSGRVQPHSRRGLGVPRRGPRGLLGQSRQTGVLAGACTTGHLGARRWRSGVDRRPAGPAGCGRLGCVRDRVGERRSLDCPRGAVQDQPVHGHLAVPRPPLDATCRSHSAHSDVDKCGRSRGHLRYRSCRPKPAERPHRPGGDQHPGIRRLAPVVPPRGARQVPAGAGRARPAPVCGRQPRLPRTRVRQESGVAGAVVPAHLDNRATAPNARLPADLARGGDTEELHGARFPGVDGATLRQVSAAVGRYGPAPRPPARRHRRVPTVVHDRHAGSALHPHLLSRCVLGLQRQEEHVSSVPRYLAAYKRWAVASLMQRTSHIMAASEMTRDLLLERLQIPEHRITVVPHRGLDTETFAPTGIGAGTDSVAYVGKLTAAKGVDLLINAVRAVRAEGDRDIRLELLGPIGKADPDILALALDTDWVTLHEARPNSTIPEFLAGSSLFVMPSRAAPDHEEHDGRALFEAMSCGLVCVGSEVGVIPELLRGGRGYLFARDSLAGLTAALRAALEDNHGRRRSVELARHHILTELSLDAVAMSRIGCAYRTQVELHVSS
ncbi:MAG: glycosyltransferase family 4 protein [Geodermatophilaceae bacterium]